MAAHDDFYEGSRRLATMSFPRKARLNADNPTTLTPPSKLAMLKEARVALDLIRMLLPLAGAQLRPAASPRGSPIIVAPGFGSDNRYTRPLRHYLQRLGFRAEGWGLGLNLAGVNLEHQLDDLSGGWDVARREVYNGEGSVPYLCDLFTDQVHARFKHFGEPITLIGWSLGGYVAREAARDLPNAVCRVITLGSPTIGGPKYTAAASFFASRHMDMDWIETEVAKRESRPIQQPITAIVSRSDAIVSWAAAQDHYSPNVRHIEVNAAHLGMGFNPTIWRHITQALAR
ncbi:MAG: pimeloyl-ACP methyl ester carboxylesterase [Candidatus Azotimanducaceae bacterium]